MTRILFLFAFMFIACNDIPTVDCVEDNGEGTNWLEDRIEMMKNDGMSSEIYTYKYKGNTVFGIADCMDCADAMYVIYNCNGTAICQFGGIAGFNTCPDFEAEATEKTLYWKD